MNNVISLVFFSLAIVLVGLIIFIVISLSNHGKKNLNVEYYRTKCLKNEQTFKKDDPSTYAMAVLTADKLVEHAMKEKGMPGQTMGERLKNSPKSFSDINGLWRSHKLRNKIAHEPDVKVNYNDAKDAMIQFRRALKDLGAI